MAKEHARFVCSNCEKTYTKWVGVCSGCKEFGTVAEDRSLTKSTGSVGLKGNLESSHVSRSARRVGDIDTKGHKHTPSGIGEFDRILGGGIVAGQTILLAGEPGVGKALSLDTFLATPNGWITMGDAKVGDVLIDSQGNPTNVIAVTEVMNERPCYKLTFSDGTTVIADANHEWYTNTRLERLRGLPQKVRTTKEIYETQKYGVAQRVNHSINLAKAITGEDQDLTLPPYTLGAWLGDGHSKGNRISGVDSEVFDMIQSEGLVVRKVAGKYNYSVTTRKRDKILLEERLCLNCNTNFAPAVYSQEMCSNKCVAGMSKREKKSLFCLDCGKSIAGFDGCMGLCKSCTHSDTLLGRLKSLGVYDNKHIPRQYLSATKEKRQALLAGLLDTDGSANKNGAVDFAVTSKQLAENAHELMTGLGYRVHRSQKVVNGRTADSSISYRLFFTPSQSPFNITRKSARVVNGNRATQNKRYITSVTPINSVPVKCVQVDSPDHTYLITKSHIPTHNSTILLAVANSIANTGKTVLYVSGEESAEQITLRARRTNTLSNDLFIADETDLSVLLGHIEEVNPDLLIVDSVQTIASPDVDGRAGGISQVQEVASSLTRISKSRHMPTILVGQITKDGAIGGPKQLEHLVDTVIEFFGDKNTPLRIMRVIKNRFGPSDEVSCWEQTETGIVEVSDPSSLFRTGRDCITVTMEGRRALLAEVQALVAPTNAPNPRRGVSGLDTARMAMLVAVTEKHGRLRLYDKDTYLATVAGMRITEPAADLAVCLAIASANLDAPLPLDVAAIGEVALSGDIRATTNMGIRLNEAGRLGFTRILVPVGTKMPPKLEGVVLLPVAHIGHALRLLKQLSESVAKNTAEEDE